MENMQIRRDELAAEIARLEQAVRDAEDQAATMLAAGKSTDAATKGMEQASTQLRITRQALVAVERAMAAQAIEAKGQRARDAQASAARLDAEAERLLLELREQLAATLATAQALTALRGGLTAATWAGAKTRHSGFGCNVLHLQTDLANVDRHLVATMDADVLKSLGLSKPPTARERSIAEVEARLAGNAQRIADTKAAMAGAESPGPYEALLRELQAADKAMCEQLATLRGDRPARLTKRERERQLETMGSAN